MPIPEFVVELRRQIGTALLWMPGVTAVVRRDGPGGLEILLVRRADNGEWTPVTGIVDPGEAPGVTAGREAMEEAGVVIRVDRLASISVTEVITYPNGDRSQYVDHTFACTWVSGEAYVADEESVEVGWYPADALPEMAPAILARIEAALSDETAARFEA